VSNEGPVSERLDGGNDTDDSPPLPAGDEAAADAGTGENDSPQGAERAADWLRARLTDEQFDGLDEPWATGYNHVQRSPAIWTSLIRPEAPKWWQFRKKRQASRPSGKVDLEQISTELRKARAEAEGVESDVKMKRWVGYGSLLFMVVQIGVADWAFVKYGRHNGWDIPSEAMDFWLGATVVQVAIVVRTVANYLFRSSQ
jgi:hypothetical protein